MGSKTLRHLGTAGLALVLGACVSLDTETALQPVDIPAEWAAVSDELTPVMPVTGDWLADLGDPEINEIVAETLAYNNDLGAARARVYAAREAARIQRSSLLPSLTGSIGASRSRSPGGTIFSGGEVRELQGGYTNATGLDLTLSWEADVWGRLTDQTRAAYLRYDAQGFDYAAARLSIAGAAGQSWYRLAEARLQRQLSERDVETGKANLRIIERRYDRGISSALDVRLARSSLASSEATLVQRRQIEQEAARQLEVLLGRYPAARIVAAEALPEIAPMMGADGAVIGLGNPLSLLYRRPDVLAAEARLEAAGLDLAAARKQFLPALRISGTGRWDDTSLADLFDLDRVTANLAASLVQPLFQGGRLKAQAGARRYELEATVFGYAQTVLAAYQEVENALAAERFFTARLDARELAFEEAVAAEELTTRQYLSGTTNIFNLISAQQRRISAESQFIAAAQARLSNRIDLYLALGAPFEAPQAPLRTARPLPVANGDPS